MSDKLQHHYFATWALGYECAETEEAAIEKLCKRWAHDLKRTQLNMQKEGEFGVTIFTCRVPLANDERYSIEWYVPQVEGLTESRNHILTYITKTACKTKRDPADKIKSLRRELKAFTGPEAGVIS